jgi:hypothetical protein
LASTLIDYNSSAACEYLKVIHQHVIHPLEQTSLADSCFAASMLIFGAIDGLGKLIDDDDKAHAVDRFKTFLVMLGSVYTRVEDKLWALRNRLAHNAMNVACFMSKMEDARGEHLEVENDNVFVHTGRLLEDFKLAIHKLEEDFKNDPVLLQRAEARLEWDSINRPGWRGNRVMTTRPPGVRFVRER